MRTVVRVVLWSRGGAHLTKTGWSKPHTHSNPTNFTLFRHKITLYRFNQGAHTIAGGSNGNRGVSPPSPLTLTTACGSDGQHNEAGESSLQYWSCHDDWKHHSLELYPVNWFLLYDAGSVDEAVSGGDIGERRDTPEFEVGGGVTNIDVPKVSDCYVYLCTRYRDILL